MKVKTSSILTVLLTMLIVCTVSDLDAQSRKERKLAERAKAKEIVQTVKDGGLLIELSGYGRQVTEIDKLLASDNVNDEAKRKLAEKKQSLIEEGHHWRDMVTMAFDSLYSYGDFEVRFRHERNAYQPEKKVIVIAQGQTKSQGIDAFFFMDYHFHTIGPPAPSYIKLRSFMSLISFGKDETRFKALKLAKSTQRAMEDLEEKGVISH